MGQPDGSGESYDLRDPAQAAAFDAKTFGMTPRPYSYHMEHRAARRAERERRAADATPTETATQ